MDIQKLLRNARWAVLFLSVGCVLGFFGGCFYLHEASVPSAIATLVGVPMALVGLGLKGAELSPVAYRDMTEADRASLKITATATQAQILEEVTRFQYGPTVHLETALEKLGIESEETDEHPPLVGVREAAIEGAYGLVLYFGALEDVGLDFWKAKEEQMTRFFGPNVKVTADSPKGENIEVTIVATAA